MLAGGLSKIYPPEHADLAAEVAASGALVTESCMDMAPMADLFPKRNRIIAGMSRAVVVIEAAEKSGALITARLAIEQGREVFAVPGQVDSAASLGSLQLLRKGAKLVRNADDVLEDLQGLAPMVEPKRRRRRRRDWTRRSKGFGTRWPSGAWSTNSPISSPCRSTN